MKLDLKRISQITATLLALAGSSSPAADHFTVTSGPREVEVLMIHKPDQHFQETKTEAKKPALVIGLHGYGINEKQMATLVGLELSEPFVYVAPRGFYELSSPNGKGNDGHGWFPIEVVDDQVLINPANLSEAVQGVVAMVPQMVAHTGSCPDQVYLVGYSQGAVVSLAAALQAPESFAGVAVLSGRLFDEIAEAKSNDTVTPLFIGHGTLDSLITTEQMRATRDRMSDLGYAVEYREYNIPHVVSRAEREDLQRWLDARIASQAECEDEEDAP